MSPLPRPRLSGARRVAAASLLCLAVPAGAVWLPVTADPVTDRPLVSVRICDPSQTCVTMPRVLLDTRSVGLRLFDASPLSVLSLPPVRMSPTLGGHRLAACSPLADGLVWGTLYRARVGLGELQTTHPIPVQFARDPLLEHTPRPERCAAASAADAPTRLGPEVNGILGLAPLQIDCGLGCMAAPILPRYFRLREDGALASPAAIPAMTALQLRNPIDALATPYGGGASLLLPQPGAGGGSAGVGRLTLGLGPRADNAPPPGSTPFMVDRAGMAQPLAAQPTPGVEPLPADGIELDRLGLYGRWIGLELGPTLADHGTVWLAPAPAPDA